MSISNLAAMNKFQKNIWSKVRLVGLINIDTKEYPNTPPFMSVVFRFCFLSLTLRKFRFKGKIMRRHLVETIGSLSMQRFSTTDGNR